MMRRNQKDSIGPSSPALTANGIHHTNSVRQPKLFPINGEQPLIDTALHRFDCRLKLSLWFSFWEIYQSNKWK